jgi:hypothetical protein
LSKENTGMLKCWNEGQGRNTAEKSWISATLQEDEK